MLLQVLSRNERTRRTADWPDTALLTLVLVTVNTCTKLALVCRISGAVPGRASLFVLWVMSRDERQFKCFVTACWARLIYYCLYLNLLLASSLARRHVHYLRTRETRLKNRELFRRGHAASAHRDSSTTTPYSRLHSYSELLFQTCILLTITSKNSFQINLLNLEFIDSNWSKLMRYDENPF